ncbi:YlqD family protein [Caldibacillus lycopersici]|uniref:YlqD family protein n=1 Tax=Perspicuibacillus lycopersici TaxID=1325689 RepID=A0AAE3IPM9_9BACI|nr:YlqD family protein [Perspicuibacillus lycopersici]MCU9612127.1 YlqD family protein [Perspicuibacillus lycopersici]
MRLITNITVKQILTENSKEELSNSFTKRKLQLQKEMDQLRFEVKRLEKTKKYQITHLQQYFEKELDDRAEKIKLLDFQLEQLELLPIGAELKEREVQGMIDVKVGDNWNELMLGKTIVVKDGIIEDIH